MLTKVPHRAKFLQKKVLVLNYLQIRKWSTGAEHRTEANRVMSQMITHSHLKSTAIDEFWNTMKNSHLFNQTLKLLFSFIILNIPQSQSLDIKWEGVV